MDRSCVLRSGDVARFQVRDPPLIAADEISIAVTNAAKPL
jgi:hypothetical protein